MSVVGAAYTQPSEVEYLVREKLRGKKAFVFPKDSVFFYSKYEISNAIVTAFPHIKEAKINLKGVTGIEAEVVERKSVAVWCADVSSLSANCKHLDAEAVVYGEVSPDDTAVRYYGQVTNDTPQRFLSPDRFSSLTVLVSDLATAAASPSKLVVVGTDNYVSVEFVNGFTIMFAGEAKSTDVLSRFALARSAEPFFGKSLSQFEYLDLRFGDKLYYKFR